MGLVHELCTALLALAVAVRAQETGDGDATGEDAVFAMTMGCRETDLGGGDRFVFAVKAVNNSITGFERSGTTLRRQPTDNLAT